MRLTSRLTSSSSSKSSLLTPSTSSFLSFCRLRHSNKKIFIAFVILILTLTVGSYIWQRSDVAASAAAARQPQKVGQTNLLPKKLELQQNELVTTTQNVFAVTNNDDDDMQQQQQQPTEQPPTVPQQQERASKHQQFDSLYYEQRRDWHDYIKIAKDAESSPNDLGAFGKAAYLKTGHDADIEQKISQSLQDFGFNVPLSNEISLERALPDSRHERCETRTYHARLPTVSIIIVYHNEQRSVFLRTLHSLINRTPSKLLKEILLVDDESEPSILGADFEEVIELGFNNITQVIHAPKRLGLIKARLLGARAATGEVLVFLDAHIEATHNWLPPLLEPIYLNANTCTTPIIDTIDYENFAYVPAAAARGGFNWQFNYVQLPLRLQERLKLPEPHENPVMNGGLFAISAKFFWQLGGYDEGLEIWGAEQFELSFKIWMCGGRLLEVPCARLGHLYRSPMYRVKYTNRTDDFISRNYKRVAEVWLDSYKESLYEHMPKLNGIDAGDLTARKALRKSLNCKSFRWFLQQIAPDILQVYPPLEPVDFAKGAIQSMAAPALCLDTLSKSTKEIVGFLRDCSPDLRHPYASQRWSLSFRRDLRDSNGGCVEPQTWSRDAPIRLWPCHHQGGNQFWYYDRLSRMLVQGSGANETERRCLEADPARKQAFLNDCDFVKPQMKWHFGYVNQTAMDNFFKPINLNY